MTRIIRVDQLLQRLEGVKKEANGWVAKCPCHDDKKPSLRISEGDDGKLLVTCRANCPQDLVWKTIKDLVGPLENDKKPTEREVASYKYIDAEGVELYETVRYERSDGTKTFKVRRPNGKGGYEWGRGGRPAILYRLPQVLNAVATGTAVYIVEGEKCVEAMELAGKVATCNPFGAGKWRDEHTSALDGAKKIAIVADKDTPGYRHALAIYNSLSTNTAGAELKLLVAKDGKDAADHLAAGHGVSDFVTTTVDELNTLLPGDATPENKADADEDRVDEIAAFLDRPHVQVEPQPLAHTLAGLAQYFQRYVVVDRLAIATCALWTAHTYIVAEYAYATPYLSFRSPEPGSGKTTALEAAELVAHRGIVVDDMTPATLFRIIDGYHPTVLYDEIDAVFGKDAKDSLSQGIRQTLNSGYRKNKKAIRAVERKNAKGGYGLEMYDLYCPKGLAGINALPATLETRSITIPMKPAKKDERRDDFELDEAEREAVLLRSHLHAWSQDAATASALTDAGRKPGRQEFLSARGNQIWMILFRIADLAGGHWPTIAREAAREFSSSEQGAGELSGGVQLLADIRSVFLGDKMATKDLVAALNASDDMPYGGWNKGDGMKTQELGHKLKRYRIKAKNVRMPDGHVPKGYEVGQFEDVWQRYLPEPGLKSATTATTHYPSQKSAPRKALQTPDVALSEQPAKPHEQRDVAVVAVLEPVSREAVLVVGDEGYHWKLDQALANGHLTEREHGERLRLHEAIRRLQ
jgi:hypothetical protein